MTTDILLVLAILCLTVVLLMTEKLRVDAVAILVMLTLVSFGLLTPSEGLAGFANPATITVGAMFILSYGLQQTGAVNELGKWLVKLAGSSQTRLSFSIMGAVAVMSAFINNTAAVAVFLPLTLKVARDLKESPSRLLMPLSFAAMFGGTCTLIGTSTNILVDVIAQENGLDGFSMFEFLPLGLLITGIGMLYMLTIGHRLIPDRQVQNQLSDGYELRHYLTEVEVLPNSPLVGQTVPQTQSALDSDINIIDIIRDQQDIPLSSVTGILQTGDKLIISSNLQALVQLMGRAEWQIMPEVSMKDISFSDPSYTLAEAVIASQSKLIGQTLRQSDFRHQYNVVVLGIQHHGKLIYSNLADLRLQVSDVLLLYGERDEIDELHKFKDFFMLRAVPGVQVRSQKAPLALAIVAGVVLLAALELLPIVVSAVLGGFLMVLTRIISLDEAYQALDAQVLTMLAGILSLGVAMEKSGTAAYLADLAINLAGPYGPMALLSVFYLMTTLLTSVMSNNATAALLAPIVISVAAELNMSPIPFLIAVTFAASASFMTPIGYQTNIMIYGPGGYRFFDFMRVGTPLTLLLWVISSLLIPVFWPF